MAGVSHYLHFSKSFIYYNVCSHFFMESYLYFTQRDNIIKYLYKGILVFSAKGSGFVCALGLPLTIKLKLPQNSHCVESGIKYQISINQWYS